MYISNLTVEEYNAIKDFRRMRQEEQNIIRDTLDATRKMNKNKNKIINIKEFIKN